MAHLPKTATAPFCPSEVRGTIQISATAPLWRKILTFAGPGFLIAVGYVDPGNWATDIEAGSKYGYALLWVILASSLSAMMLQMLSLRLGLVAQKDLARLCRERYSPALNMFLWLAAEVSIIACDVAEVFGASLAFHLLFGVSLLVGAILTAFDTIVVLGFKGRGFRYVEAIVLGFLVTIGVCFIGQLLFVGLDWGQIMAGFVPRLQSISKTDSLYIAIGIIGATVMPHNLYLHSSIVQTRQIDDAGDERQSAIGLFTADALVSLILAFVMNAAILVLAAAAFHATGHDDVTDIGEAYRLLGPVVGNSLAPLLFGIALLAAGQSSTFTGTIAGQVIIEGFRDWKIPCWQRRLLTRFLALVPAIGGIVWFGEKGVGNLLVASQVVLSLQLPFAMWPLISFSSDKRIMGDYANGGFVRVLAIALFLAITGANLYLLYSLL